ncbi:hypothetical protein NA56DRAFT_150948 [Hyaloscypha hepaticicola]|uniref:Uncharacterized protein n=1 Tax=Hyaloscypha hepaticicola TaxID=2082293 RepID=A0A2J6QNS4_9HELO|nr:hypothetical protein NA56DRAFT_150948 [Hyaloscypha hepaticicola]
MRTEQRQRLGTTQISKLQLRSGRSFASLFQPRYHPQQGNSKEVYITPTISHRNHSGKSSHLYSSRASPIRSSPTGAGDKPTGPQQLGVPRPPPSWPEVGGSRAVASAVCGHCGPFGSAAGASWATLKRGNINGRVDDQANQRTAVAARPAHEKCR